MLHRAGERDDEIGKTSGRDHGALAELRLEARLGISLSLVDFLKGLSLNQLVEKALAQLSEPSRASGAAIAAGPQNGTTAAAPDSSGGR